MAGCCIGLLGVAKGPLLALVTPSKQHLTRSARVGVQTPHREPFPGPSPGNVPRVPLMHSSLQGWSDLQFGIAGSAWAGWSELSASGNNSSTTIPSILASVQSIAFCVSSQCTAAHVQTHKNTN